MALSLTSSSPFVTPPIDQLSEVRVIKSSQNFGKFSQKKGQLSPACAARAMAFLKAQHPVKTAEEIEAATRGLVAAATARKWLACVSAPSFLACLALIEAYGPAFLNAVMAEPPRWLSAALREEQLAQLKAAQAQLAAEIERVEG